ncbi:hypothetical protein ACA910_017245 [Epithemia clementina (nom. ined.)]
MFASSIFGCQRSSFVRQCRRHYKHHQLIVNNWRGWRHFTSSSRPFRILGVQQVAVGSEDRSALTRLWCDIFGLSASSTHRIEKENVEEDILQLGPSPFKVELDLMTPIDPEKSPKVHKPPLNHLGLWIDNLEQAVEWMKGRGVRFAPGGIRTGAAGHLVAFIHPKGDEEHPIGGNGVLIELVQAPQEVIEAFTAAKDGEK